MTQTTGRKETSSGLVLFMLLIVYTFNFLDRQILSILAQPVKDELGFTDTQMGALGGLAFAIFYSTLAIPLGLLADRKGRSGVIAVSLAVWSGFTALCGFAGSFAQMFLFRLGVGVGEAGGVAPSYALISEHFPPEKRARAISIYSLGIPLGTALGAFFGAAIAQAVSWRAAFFALGIAGILFALPFRMMVRDPVRVTHEDDMPAKAVFRSLAAQPAFWMMSFGAGIGSMCGYGIAFWLPALLQRSMKLDLLQTGQFLGAQVLIAGVTGVLLGGFLADWLGKNDKAYFARVPAVAYLLGMPLYAFAFMAQTPTATFFALLIPSALSYVWIGPIVTAVQHLVGPRERATASACFLLINNGIGLGLGALVMGWISDTLSATHGNDSLRLALTWSLGGYLISAVLMLLAAPRLRKAWMG